MQSSPTVPESEASTATFGSSRIRPLQIALLAGVVVLSRLLWVRACPIYDDAFITYRFARNMAQGLGLVFNPGAEWEPVLGTTTPGYAILLACLHRLGLGLIPASLGVNFLCDGISAVLICLLLRRALVPSLIAVACFAAMPDLGRISSGGMEAPLFVLLVLAAAYARERGRPLSSGTCAALACTIRPEAVLLVGIVGTSYLIRDRKDFLRFVLPVGVIGVVYASALALVYGSPIPQSVKAKASAHVARVQISRLRDIAQLAFFPIKYMIVFLPIIAVGIVRSLRQGLGLRLASLVALAIVSAYLLARPKTWGWYYYVPLTAWTLWLGLGTEALVKSWSTASGWGRALARYAVPAMAVLVLATVGTATHLHPDLVTERVYGEMARWIEEDQIQERGASVMASDIGAIGWFAETRILDSMGLVWPEAVTHETQIEVIRAQYPEYVMIVAIRPRIDPFLADPELFALYEPIRRFNVHGLQGLAPESGKLPGGWIQDYIVYRRRDVE